MGSVYQAEHVLMKKRVAVKILHDKFALNSEVVQRFEREARAAASIVHRHVAGATDFGKLEDGRVYLVLEYVEGTPLRDILDEGPLSLGRSLSIVSQTASALAAAHEKRIVHRDLKPENLMLLGGSEEQDFVKVLDFGVAKVLAETTANESGNEQISQSGRIYGTPEYMAPEQALGQEIDARADLYSVGVLLFEMITGRRPYQGPAAGLLGQQLSVSLPPLSQLLGVPIDESVQELVSDLLATDPEKRLPSATVLLDRVAVLQKSLTPDTLQAVPAPRPKIQPEQHSSTSLRPRRKRWLLALPVLVGGSLLAAGFFALRSSELPQPREVDIEPVRIEAEASPLPLPRDLKQKLEQASGLQELVQLSLEYPDQGRVRAQLSLELSKQKQFEQAVREARTALELEPRLNESPKVAGAIFRAAQSTEARSAAFRLLAGPMGDAGASILYDLNTTPGINKEVSDRAGRALASDAVRKSASPALLLALDLSSRPACEQAAKLIERAQAVGDKRSLPLLLTYQSDSGCGAKGTEDCHPCLGDRKTLQQAIEKIEQRATLDGAQ